MIRFAMLAVAAALLAACSSEPAVEIRNASVDEVASEVAKAGGKDILLRAGKWRTRVTVDDVSIPGLPPRAQEQMKLVFAEQQNVTVDHCVTPEQAKRPASDFFTGKQADTCRYDRFTMAGGKVDAVMRCTGQGSGDMKMTMSGVYTAESATTNSEMVVSSGQGNITMKARSEAKRTGECDGKES